MKDKVRPIALAMILGTLGFLLRLLLDAFLNVEISKLVASVLNFALAAFAAFVVFPKGLKQPMVGGACLLTKVATEKLGVQAQTELYQAGRIEVVNKSKDTTETRHSVA